MSNFRKFDDRLWDRFFEFIETVEEPRSMAEVDNELRRRGIDVAPTVERVLKAVHAAAARSALARARENRPTVIARLAALAAPMASGLREQLREVIAKRFEGSVRAAYFSKLERAASEQDLQTLLQDIERLDALEGGPKGGDTAGQ
jgi:predicted TIM-barrel fold metal-dependent hydrolase